LRVVAYPFEDVRTKAQNYWRDVGTVDAYYEANMELVRVSPELNIYDEQWPIWTYQEQLPPAKFVFDDVDRRGSAVDSMVSGGCIISGSRVANSCFSRTCACTTIPRSNDRSSCRARASASVS
jgi:glucose-1-phosphate adenylyltransferase